MSLSSAMGAAIAGLAGNSARFAGISDNISNAGTYGYKRVVTEFDSLVLGQNGGLYSAGGVRTATTREIGQQGGLVSTNKSLDLAMSGAGMLPVATTADVEKNGGNLSLLMTRTGGFEVKANGLVATDSGLVLLGWPANSDGTVPTPSRNSVSDLRPVRVSPSKAFTDPTTHINLGITLPANETLPSATLPEIITPVEYFGNLGTAEKLEFIFTPLREASGGRSNFWGVEVRDLASQGTDNVIGKLRIQFSEEQETRGTISSVEVVDAKGAYDEAGGNLELILSSGDALSVAIGKIADPNGLLGNIAGKFDASGVTKNGAAIGKFKQLTVDETGLVKATYDTGLVKTLYQVPVVAFPNIDGLDAGSSQTYSVSTKSGDFYLWDAGDGPTGTIKNFRRESSTTDIAAELTNMIQTQRNFTSNAKIIQTADELLQETVNIKR